MAIQVVELFGSARLIAGARSVELEVPDGAPVRAVIPVLARWCPALVGPVLPPDLSSLGAGYTFSVNGRVFLDDLETRLAPGDSLLLLPAAAGGMQ